MTDEKIVALYWERSETAIAETQKKYHGFCTYIARRILCDWEESEEVVNDTYLKVWNTVPPERPDPLKAFLGRVTRQLAINRLERNTAQKRGGGEYPLVLNELEECIPDGNSGEDLEDTLALQTVLNDFLRSLPDKTRNIFIRRYWYLCTIEEIAKGYGMGQSNVKMLLLRTRNKLKQYLEQEGFIL